MLTQQVKCLGAGWSSGCWGAGGVWGEKLSSVEQRGVGVPSTPCGPCSSQGWEHPWVQGGVTGCGLGPTLVLSPLFCQARGEEQPPARRGTWKQPMGSWVRRGELRPGTPELSSPCSWVPLALTLWAEAGAVAHVHASRPPLWARTPLGRGRLGDAPAVPLLPGLRVSPRVPDRARRRDSDRFGGSPALCRGWDGTWHCRGHIQALSPGDRAGVGAAMGVWGGCDSLGSRLCPGLVLTPARQALARL